MTTRYTFSLKGRQALAKPYHFKGAGLPNVYLRSGVKIEKDQDYGELVTIEKLPGLFHAIAFTLVAKPEPLTGGEMRFLRKRMDATQADLARELRVSEQTVANYEKGATKDGPADTAVRLLYIANLVDDDDLADDFRERAIELMRRRNQGRAAPVAAPGHWQAEAR
jgi:DNA-binding transcriptional regulator YiaG